MYTDRQIEMLSRFRGGMVWVFHLPGHEQDDDLVRFLLDQKLVEPRANISPDYYVLSEGGQIVLEQREKVLQENAQKDTADQRSKRADRLFQVALLVIGGAITLLVEHFAEVVCFVAGLFQ